eukprot:14094145-Alexandrium_andersonii.AAC.1
MKQKRTSANDEDGSDVPCGAAAEDHRTNTLAGTGAQAHAMSILRAWARCTRAPTRFRARACDGLRARVR